MLELSYNNVNWLAVRSVLFVLKIYDFIQCLYKNW